MDRSASAWLDLLDHPDSGAWDDLDRLRAKVAEDHPIIQTVDFLSFDAEELRRLSSPALAYYAERVRDEPGAFARCVLERARRARFVPAEQVRRCRPLFHDRPRLDALAMAYEVATGGVLIPRMNGPQVIAAFRALVGDGDLSALDGSTREMVASVLEVEIDRCALRHRWLAVETLLDLLEPLLESCPIAGRRASVLVLRARLHLGLDEIGVAISALIDAERELLADLDDRQRFEILFLLAQAEITIGREDAEAVLSRAESLADTWAHFGQLATLHYLRGIVHRRAGRDDEAEASWIESERLRGVVRGPAALALDKLRGERRRRSTGGGGGRASGAEREGAG